MPAARTRMRTRPGPSDGSGRSWISKTSGPPWRGSTAARIERANLRGYRALEGHGPPGDEVVLRDQAVDNGFGDQRAGGDDHHRALVVDAFGRVADGCRGDVDAGVAKRGADAADHPRHVAVLEEGQVLLELQVEALVPRFEQVRAVPAAQHGADHAGALVA